MQVLNEAARNRRHLTFTKTCGRRELLNMVTVEGCCLALMCVVLFDLVVWVCLFCCLSFMNY